MPRPRLATWYSPAKVNLCLRIVGRRADGYHLLDSVFAAIDLCDRIFLSVEELADGAPSEVVVRCDAPGVPADGTNLAARAATMLLEACGVAARVTIEIDKRIPAGAGLGGGSSNAATVLRALSELLELAIEPAGLCHLALGLGADVPFFLTGGHARVRGIGDRVQAIAGWPEVALAVVVPPVAVSTAWAFRTYPPHRLPDRLEPETEADRLAAGHPLDGSTMVNDLEHVVLPAYPDVARAKERLIAAGATAAVMSGSGSAVVAVVPNATVRRTIEDAFAAHTEHRTLLHLGRVLPGGPFVG